MHQSRGAVNGATGGSTFSMMSYHPHPRPIRPRLDIAGATLTAVGPPADVRHWIARPQLGGEVADWQHCVVETDVAPGPHVEALGGKFCKCDGAGHVGIVARDLRRGKGLA